MNARLPLLCVAGCGLLIPQAKPVQAQDITAAPTFGSVSLSSGFSPDPYVVQISAGGALNAADVSANCVGYVANAPNFSLHYDQDRYALSIFAVADRDTTLVVNDPGGAWHCNDDSGDLDDANPGLFFSTPRSGRYDIWIGNYSTANNFINARLVISEQGAQNWRTIAAGLGASTSPPLDVIDPPVVTPAEPVPVRVPEPEPEPEPEPVPVPVPVPTEGAIQYGRKMN